LAISAAGRLAARLFSNSLSEVVQRRAWCDAHFTSLLLLKITSLLLLKIRRKFKLPMSGFKTPNLKFYSYLMSATGQTGEKMRVKVRWGFFHSFVLESVS
jgi:hypothetical protein